MTNTTSRRESGFTLVELLIVVLIIGILATIAIPVFNGQRAKAKNSAAQSSVRNAMSAAHSYAATSDTYSGLTQSGLSSEESSIKTGAVSSAPGTNADPAVVDVSGFATTGNASGTGADASAPSATTGITVCAASKGDQVYCMRSNLQGGDKFGKGPNLNDARADATKTSW